jgi:uncharacterized protein (UPF0333 family)
MCSNTAKKFLKVSQEKRGENMLRKRKAQSTLEYIIIFTVIVVAVFILAYSLLKPGVEKVVNSSAKEMGDAADKFKLNP